MVTKEYLAEFNNGTFDGDITGTDGVFSGTLTADAVNAVDNITIAGSSVAVTESAFLADTGLRWNDDAIYRDVHKINILTPPKDREGGIFRVLFQFQTIDGKDDNAHFDCQFRILHNTTTVWESGIAPQRIYQYAGQYFSFLVSGAMTFGLHTFSLQYRIFPSPTNAYPRFYNVRVVLDYVRK